MDAKYSLDDVSIVRLDERSVRPEVEIITTPTVERAWELFENCRIAQAMGVIQGPSGTGKSFLLKAIQKRFAQSGRAGTVSIIECCQATGASSGVRAILLEMGIGGAVTSNRTVAGLGYLLKIARREINQRGINAICLDDADNYAPDALAGIVSLFNHLKESGYPIVILFTGVLPEENWIAQLPAAVTRTLHVERTAAMPVVLMAGVLKRWAAPLPALVEAYQAGDKDAEKALRLIHGHTSGVFRRVRYFADLAIEKSPSGLSLETVEAILAQMTN